MIGLAAAAAGLRLWLAGKIVAPQLLCDEFIYADIAKNVASEGRFALRQQPSHFSLAYPLLLSPAWFASSMATVYDLAKALNVVAMTLAVAPLYLWARRLVRPWYAVLAAGLVLCMPAFAYTGMLMSENAFLPTFLLAAFAISLTLEKPTVGRQALALAGIGLACATRVQGLVLLPVFFSAVLLMLIFEQITPTDAARVPLSATLRRYAPSLGAVAALAGGFVALQLARGEPISAGFGSYSDVIRFDYSLTESLRWSLYHLAALALSVGVVPLAAYIVLVGGALSGRLRTDPADRAFLAVTGSAVLWIAIQAGLFTSRFAAGIAERYVFYVAPLLLLSLVVWLERGLPRPRLLTAIGVVVTAGLVFWLPLERFIATSPIYNSFGLFPFFRAAVRISGGAHRVELLVDLGALGIVLGLVLLPRRLLRVATPAALLAFFVLSSISVFRALEDQAGVLRSQPSVGPDTSWVERELGRNAQASFIYTPGLDGRTASTVSLLETAFWNRNVRWVSNVGQSELCPLPEKSGGIDYATGQLLPAPGEGSFAAPHVVADSSLNLAGRALARHGSLVLYRIDPPLRIASLTEGVYGDGWMGQTAAFTRYGAASESGGQVQVNLSRAAWGGPDVPGRIRVAIGTVALAANGSPAIGRRTAVRTGVIHSLTARRFSLPVPGPRFRVEVRIDPTFSPSDYGRTDLRQLGAQVVFTYAQSARRTSSQ